MCRSIKTLFNYNPPVTHEDIHAASLQFVRKVSGFREPSQVNEEAFEAAVKKTEVVVAGLLKSLKTKSPRRNRKEEEAKKAQEAKERFHSH